MQDIKDNDLLKKYTTYKKAEIKLKEEKKKLINSEENDNYSFFMIDDQIDENRYELQKIKDELFRRCMSKKVNQIDKQFKQGLEKYKN